MRIIAGTHKGHRIDAPKGRTTRPTSDRVRENVFNLVAPWVEDADAIGRRARARAARRDDAPVSYTHLTLPTILRV